MSVEAAIDRLQAMGYLKHVAASQIASVRSQMAKSLQDGYLDTSWDADRVSADRRTYPADAEDLAEGGFGLILTLMKPVLKTEGVRIDSIEDDFGEAHYSVVIDGSAHSIWQEGENEGDSLGIISTRRCLSLVNGLLQKTSSSERLWGVYGGNKGRFHLLTAEMQQLLKNPSLGLDLRWMPYPSTDPRLVP
ncbi:MAG TPA: hypothetical protein VE981_00940 [Planctomycetota bacterium]|nr:hypothetical protein [Planctomycetota bacterium]